MSVFIKSLSLEVLHTVNIHKKSIKYFSDHGFKLIRSDKDRIVFKRGSSNSNKWSFNPLKWNSKIKVYIKKDNTIITNFIVDITHQLVRVKEIQLWNTFIQNYEQYLINDIDYLPVNKKSIRKTRNNNISLAVCTLFFALAGCAIGLLISIYAHLPIFIPIGTLVPPIIYFWRRIKKDHESLQH